MVLTLKNNTALSRAETEMIVFGGQIIKGPEGYFAIFHAEISPAEYCLIFAPNQYRGKILAAQMTPDKPVDLPAMDLIAAVGVNGSFNFYPVVTGLKMKGAWMISCENDVFAICYVTKRYIVLPEQEEMTKIFLSLL